MAMFQLMHEGFWAGSDTVQLVTAGNRALILPETRYHRNNKNSGQFLWSTFCCSERCPVALGRCADSRSSLSPVGAYSRSPGHPCQFFMYFGERNVPYRKVCNNMPFPGFTSFREVYCCRVRLLRKSVWFRRPVLASHWWWDDGIRI